MTKIQKLGSKYDLNKDGTVSKPELEDAAQLLELELREEKADTQRRMAWCAMIIMTVVTAALFSPFFTDSRVQALSDLLGLFFIAQAGIVGAYMGVTAWLTSKTNSSYYSARERFSARSTYGDEPSDL